MQAEQNRLRSDLEKSETKSQQHEKQAKEMTQKYEGAEHALKNHNSIVADLNKTITALKTEKVSLVYGFNSEC